MDMRSSKSNYKQEFRSYERIHDSLRMLKKYEAAILALARTGRRDKLLEIEMQNKTIKFLYLTR